MNGSNFLFLKILADGDRYEGEFFKFIQMKKKFYKIKFLILMLLFGLKEQTPRKRNLLLQQWRCLRWRLVNKQNLFLKNHH
jgi:hypothetical protein